jgi:hypothetical protein
MKYRILRGWSFGSKVWRVYLGDEYVGVFFLCRKAIAWILEQEKKA